MLGNCEPVSSFKPRKSNPPNVLKRFQPDNEEDKSFREFQSSHDKSETFPSPSKIAQEQKNKEKVVKPVGMEKPRIPAIEVGLKESLKQVTLKKTGLFVENNGMKNNHMESLNDSESCKKTIGKLDKSKFENLPSSSLVKTSVGVVNNKPPLMQKPVLKSENHFTPSIKPKPVKSNTFVSPPSQPEFPAPTDEIYDDVDVAQKNMSERNCQQKFSSLPNIKPKPPSRKKVWPPPVGPELMPDSSNDEEVYGDVDNNDTPNTQSDHRNSHLGKDESSSSNISSKPSDVVVSPAVVALSQHLSEPEYKDEIYGDVDADEESTMQLNSDGRFEEDGEAIYDSVENVIDFNPANYPQVSDEADMIYDDIADMTPSQPVQPLDPPDDIYNDVDQNGISLLQQQANPLLNNSKYKSDLYLAPADGICDTPISSPPKPAKTFGELDAIKFTIPFGLDAWLYQIICANQFKLQENGMSCNFFDSYSCGSDFPGITNLKKKPSDNDTYSIKSTDSKQEKENKKEKKRLKQLEKEKKAKELQKQKRLEKDLKNFNLDLNKELTVIGTVCASSESKGSKKDLAYQYGEEIEILQTSHECPAGKILAQNANTQRIGYIVKADFQLNDSIFADAKPRVSLIPTEDEEGLYPGSEESFQQPTVQAMPRRPAGAPPLPTVPPPPPPQTPRPLIKPVIPVQTAQEEIYAECADLVASTQKGLTEQTYDTIGVNS